MREQSVCFHSAIGDCELTWSEAGLTRVRLLAGGIDQEGVQQPHEPIPEPISACIARLRLYASGAAVDFADVALDTRRVPASLLQVYDALRQIPWGQTTTYGALDRASGASVGARAIGSAMARNPWPVIVPCHRVLAADGRLSGFSAPGGVETKRRLLALERVEHLALAPSLPGLL